MPNYHYKCERPECGHEFHEIHSIKADFLKTCPQCSENSLHTVIYNPLLISAAPRSIGHLADVNTAKLGHYERETMWEMQKQRKEHAKVAAREELKKKLPAGATIPEPPKGTPWYGEPTKDLSKLNKEQMQKYIMEGK